MRKISLEMPRKMNRRQPSPSNNDPFFEEFISRLSKRVEIVLVEPKYQGNIGAIARVMKNTGFNRLTITGNVRIEEEAEIRAMAGREILSSSKSVNSITELDHDSYLIATSSVATSTSRKYRRVTVTIDELWKKILSDNNKYSILFGREDDGLLNEEIELCHYFVSIIGNPDYPVYNISHAVGILLYKALEQYDKPELPIENMDAGDAGRLIDILAEILQKTGYPEHKIANAVVMLRRLIARSEISQKEYFKLMGIMRIISKNIINSSPEGTIKKE